MTEERLHDERFGIWQVLPIGGSQSKALKLLSAAESLGAARSACRTHLIEDGEEGPLEIRTQEGMTLSIARIDEYANVTFRESDVTRSYE
jgi:hypothetical protein